MMMSTKEVSPQWDYLIKFLSLDLANWSIYVETGESKMVIFPDIV